jgi:DNA-directed RNA polymerase subunit RPC12/RpoP
LPEHLFDDQITEILCTHCNQTSPKTIAWVRANDQYNCPGCNARIIVERDALLAAALTEDR